MSAPVGRPRIGERVAVRLPPHLLRDVDRHAGEAGMSRAAYLRALIAAGLPKDDVDRAQIRRLIRLTPAQRIQRNGELVRQVRSLRGAAGR